MAAYPLVYILVLNYCSLEDTIGCIDSVNCSDYLNIRLLVIDNASPDGSGKHLANKIPPSDFLQLGSNIGYAGGNNMGIRIALNQAADYILILNPDVRLYRETISRCISIMESDPSIGALNPVQLNGDGTDLDEKFRLGIFVRHGFSEPSVPLVGNEQWDTAILYGAALLVRRTTLERVGCFDPLFFAYGEEEDLSRRIRLRGLRLVVTAATGVRHLRTKEASVTDFVLFLRIKGLYLHTLKDPTTPFLKLLGKVCRDMVADLLCKRRNVYPFKQFQVTTRHVFKAIIWIVLHLPQIYQHRKIEHGAPYL